MYLGRDGADTRRQSEVREDGVHEDENRDGGGGVEQNSGGGLAFIREKRINAGGATHPTERT